MTADVLGRLILWTLAWCCLALGTGLGLGRWIRNGHGDER